MCQFGYANLHFPAFLSLIDSFLDGPHKRFLCKFWRAEMKQQLCGSSHMLSLICWLISLAWGYSQDCKCFTVPWIVLQFFHFLGQAFSSLGNGIGFSHRTNHTINIRSNKSWHGLQPILTGSCLSLFSTLPQLCKVQPLW